MSNPCAYCSKLTIESLVKLARQNPTPGRTNYKHHSSFGDLEAAALAGCDLCRLALECFQQRNLYEKAKSLQPSNVKLRIELRHEEAYPVGPREVLDAIVFRVGEIRVEDTGDFVDMRVGLTAKEACIPQLHPFSLDYTVEDQILGSASNFATVNQWLHRCEKGHAGCWPSETPMLPTRVIDVGTIPVNAQNDQDNLDRFQNSIPCSSLAPTFRDAITITRNLGIRYLWIDSLCIIQHCREDWEQESNNMGSIFRDATLTVFAAASRNSNGGILNKKPSLSHPKDVQLKVFSDPEDYTTVMASVKCFSPKESFQWMWSQSPLATRGWTFQEQALAPRCLIYGEKGICWKCPRKLHSSKLSQVHVRDVLRRSENSILYSPTPPGTSLVSFQVMNEYYGHVSDYSRRALTVPSDKLPAMSAIAKALSHKLAQENASSTYLAGLWEVDLPRGLMWGAISRSYAPHVSIYRAPSWSWATTDSPVTFCDRLPWAFCSEYSTDLRIVNCEVCPSNPGYPFGEVKSGRLVVEGRMIPLIRSRQKVQAEDSKYRSMGRCNYDECLDGEDPYSSASRILPVTKDKPRLLVSFIEALRLLGGSDIRAGSELEIDEALFREEEYKAVIISIMGTDSQGWKQVKGILVQRRPGREEYERVGCFSQLLIPYTWFDSIRRERLVIV
ncbi:hypothetical protein CEP53_006894 [Fusarium sp. AF-6]|nr:hypothetical protein CEP53_006894 [Fusarium sp. AF-6]